MSSGDPFFHFDVIDSIFQELSKKNVKKCEYPKSKDD